MEPKRPTASLEALLEEKFNGVPPVTPFFFKLPGQKIIEEDLAFASEYFYKYRLLETAKFCAELNSALGNSTESDSLARLRFISENSESTQGRFEFHRLMPKVEKARKARVTQLRALFDLREFKKCAFLAKESLDRSPDPHTLYFFAYSVILREQVSREEAGTDKSSPLELSREVEEAEQLLARFDARDELPDILVFLLGLIKRDRRDFPAAAKLFARALNLNPFFWTAWLELAKLLADQGVPASFASLGGLAPHWFKNFFTAQLLLENVRANEKYEIFCFDFALGLLAFFPQSGFLFHFLASLFFNKPDYDRALEFFQRLMKVDPYRYEGLDLLSNLLYVKENENELGKLAVMCFENDKYLPETCCVLGNYYSLVGERSKAATYFKRAISLDRGFLPAYILLGHEFLELKNVPSSIESYNQAIQINPRDYRGWYGLGLAYELQHHFQFALYYFLEAISLNPRDSRMWNALGSCYDKMGKKNESMKCLEKSEGLMDQEGISLFQLGKMYDQLGLTAKAVQCFEENIANKDKFKEMDKQLADSLIYLAKYYSQQNDKEKAAAYANRLLDFHGFPKEEAQNLLFEICQNK